MLIKNGTLLDKSFRFIRADMLIENGVISRIGPALPESGEVLDAEGCYVIPGLVDIHTHGCGGVDACGGTREIMDTLSLNQGKNGVTSFCATTMTVPAGQIERAMRAAGEYIRENRPAGARMAGIYMEGPFINPAKKGAQREECVLKPDAELFFRLNAASGGNIRVATVAPEMPGAMEFIERVSPSVTVSIAHTNCDYACASEAFLRGASHVTHLYNAMNGFSHRSPGPVAAAADSDAVCELICDGIHIDPAVIRATFKMMPGRINLISDSTEATGMPEGRYDLGGQTVIVSAGKVTLADGTIAGSSTNLMECVRRCASFGIPLGDAVRAASFVPAREIGMEKRIGRLAPGLLGDAAILEKDLSLRAVIIGGERKF